LNKHYRNETTVLGKDFELRELSFSNPFSFDSKTGSQAISAP
jgi:hypothetical protein